MSTTVQKNAIKVIKRIVIIAVGLYILSGILLYFFQEKVLFLPEPLSRNYQFQFNSEFKEVFLKAEDGATINAIHFKNENPKGAILYFHGNADNLRRWGKIVEYFVQMNYDVFIMDYRTYGKSNGNLTEEALYNDAQLCYHYLLERYSESEITLYGRSLGTGIATQLASKTNPKQLILETPYYSIADVAKFRFPLFPVNKLLRYKIPTYEFIQKVKCPILMIHGTDDMIVPYSSAKKLDKLGLPNVQLKTIKNGKHNNLVEFQQYHWIMKEVL